MALNTPFTPYRLVAAGSDDLTSVTAVPSLLGYVVATNINAAIRYLHIYDKASAPVMGTDTPVLTLPLPGAATGGQSVINLPVGIEFRLGIAFAINTVNATIPTTGAATAAQTVVSLGYRKL